MMSDSWIEHSFKSLSSNAASSSAKSNSSPSKSKGSQRTIKTPTKYTEYRNVTELNYKFRQPKRILDDHDDDDDTEDDDNNKKQFILDSFDPKDPKDLAISKQKLNELTNWFLDEFIKPNNNKSTRSPFLLLNGPSGSGKTITVKVLSKQYKIEVVELPATGIFNEQDLIVDNLRELSIRNSVHQNDDEVFEKRNDKIKALHSENQFNRFSRFLYDLNRFRSTVFADDDDDDNLNKRQIRKLLLIEDIPQIFFLKPELLHQELTTLYSRFKLRTVPIVFIISDTVNGASVEQKILPKSIQTRLNFNVITFKPISDTCVNKALMRTVIGKARTKSEIEEITQSSCGDIRSALNCLLFNYSGAKNNLYKSNLNTKKKRKLTVDNSSKKRAKNSGQDSEDQSNANGRNEPLTMVHAMGKVLYAKRDDFVNPEDLEFFTRFPHLNRDLLRNPLVERRPEEIAERANVQCDTIADWLHENYCDFINDDDRLQYSVDCLEVMSDVDSIFRDFESKDSMESLRTSYLIRGSMFSLNRQSSSSKSLKSNHHSFRPIRSPKMFQLNRETTENQSKLSELKQSGHLYPTAIVEMSSNLVLDILPILSHVPELLQHLKVHNLHGLVQGLINFQQQNNNNTRNTWSNQQQFQSNSDYQSTSNSTITRYDRNNRNKPYNNNGNKLTMTGYDEIDSDTIDIEDDSD